MTGVIGPARGQGLVPVYLGIALAGAIIPYLIILPWFAAHGPSWTAFFSLLFATRPAAMFSVDVLISATVFLLWADIEARRLGMRAPWQPLAAILLAGHCCALPLFLARRERALAQMPGGTDEANAA